MPISLILITSDPQTARFAVGAGVDRVMVDLESLGKQERQGHLDTLISAHSLEDVSAVAEVIERKRMIVRTNPLHAGIGIELDAVLANRPHFVMLPMVRNREEIKEYAEAVRGRAEIIPLVETRAGLESIGEITAMPEVAEVYIGLNDLHLDLGSGFIFEPLASGLIDTAIEQIKAHGKPFGFGGIARMDEGRIPGRMILAEHVRLGSTRVILSRTFHRRLSDGAGLTNDTAFQDEILRLRDAESELGGAPHARLSDAHEDLVAAVSEILTER